MGTAEVGELHGLALRFEVTIDGHNLGAWSKCEGLEVDFKPKAYAALGENGYAHQLPGPATHPSVRLTRACSRTSSGEVVKWLGAMLDPSGQQPGDATITLYDAAAAEVVKWRLHKVLPASWKGPALDAGSSKVALEVLELTHHGFAPLEDDSRAIKASLKGPGGDLTFHLNPSKLSVTRQSQWGTRPSLGGNAGTPNGGKGGKGAKGGGGSAAGTKPRCAHTQPQHRGNKPSQMMVSVTLDRSFGRGDIAAQIATLTEWTHPPGVSADGKPHPPELTFTWGGQDALKFLGYLQSLKVNYTMLAADGTPLRADVDLTMIEKPLQDPSTNPSSGGLPGRRAHRVIDGDTLASVAFAEYRDASRWRALADLNGIDDPLRLRPGTALLLLSDAELG